MNLLLSYVPVSVPLPLVQLSIAIANSRLTDKDIISLRPKNLIKRLRPRKLSLACATEYTDEQLNYYKICSLTTEVLAKGLRSIFKQEWDNHYKATKGGWKDEPRNGLNFYNGESPQNQRRNYFLFATIINYNGNRGEWDCTMLFYTCLTPTAFMV